MPGLGHRAQPRVLGSLGLAAALAASIVGGCHFDGVTTPGLDDPAALAVRGDSLLFLHDTARYAAETPETRDQGPRKIAWASSDSTIVSVDDQGLVRARRIGNATLVVTLTAPDLVAPITRSWPVRVTYASIAIDPVDSLTGLGEHRTLVLRGLDVFGAPDAVLPAVLASRDTTIVSVVAAGEIVARGAGVTTVVAMNGEHRDSVPVRVRRVAATLSFGSPTVILPAVGRDTVAPLQVRDTNDSLIPAPSLRWSSSDPTAVTVSAEGAIRALRAAPAVLTAQIDTVSATLNVSVHQTAANLEVSAGDLQTGTVGASVPIPPTVVVRDAGGYPIGDVEVVFSVSEGGGTVSDSIRTTNAEGVARVGSWTLGPRPGANRLLARVGGLITSISATAAIGSADPTASVIVVARDTVAAGGTTVVFLRARDAFGNPLVTGGATVAFHTSGGTSTGNVGATIDNGDGTYATTFAGLTAGSPTTIGATLDGDAVTSARPTITVVPGAPARLAVLVGNGQVAAAGTPVPIAPVAGVFDTLDNPVPGVQVTFAQTAGGGLVTDGVRATDQFGHAGVAAWTLGSQAGENRLTVTAQGLAATVTATGIPGPISLARSEVRVSPSVVEAGTTASVTLQSRDAFGNLVGTGGRTVGFSTLGGTSTGAFSAVTDHGDGTYTATFTGRRAGSPTTIAATIDGTPVTTSLPSVAVVAGSPARLSVLAGSGQTATVATSVSQAPVVAVYDGLDNPVPQVPVTFAVTAGGGSLLGGSQTTDSAGRAGVTAWVLGRTAGENVLTVTATELSATVTTTGVAGPVSVAQSQLTVAAGGTVPAGTTTAITLRAYDQYANPLTVGGLSIGFVLSGGTSTGKLTPVVDNGDGSYQATFTGVGAGTALTLGAMVNGDALTSLLPTITVIAGAPSRLELAAGDGQETTVGTAVPIAPTVSLSDAVGNLIAGAVVTFEVTGGGGSVTGGTQVTDSAGRVSVRAWTLGPTAGEHRLTAVAHTLRATFTATAVAGPASPTASVVVVPQDTVAVGERVNVLLRAYDAFGNPARSGGATVTFFLDGGTSSGTFAQAIDRGDGTYVAAFTAVTPGTPSYVRALVGDVEAMTPSPTLTVRGAGTRWKQP